MFEVAYQRHKYKYKYSGHKYKYPRHAVNYNPSTLEHSKSYVKKD